MSPLPFAEADDARMATSKNGALRYQTGFGNHFETEAVPGSLPKGQNSPQVCAHGKLLPGERPSPKP